MLNRPVLDYLVDDCIAAGIQNIILITREGQDLVRHYYTEHPELRTFFEQMGSSGKYNAIEKLHEKAKFTFVDQRDSDGYGTAVPVMLARPYVEREEAFLFLTGDDFMHYRDGHTAAEELISEWQETQAGAVMSCREIEADDTHRYGIVEVDEREGHRFMRSLVEKPAQGTTDSRLANISKYVLTPAIFPLLEGQTPHEGSGELYITDTISELSHSKPVAVHVPQGEYLDCGNVAGWLKANLRIAQEDPVLWDELREEFS